MIDVPTFVPRKCQGAYIHFAQRVEQRLPGIPAKSLWLSIIAAIESEHDDVTFLGRTSRDGRRAWLCDFRECRFITIFCHTACVPITVITDPAFVLAREGRPPLNVKDYIHA
ncbi:hypothetical protein [Mameliella sp.]|uniref:hypothetical protein n=1 Tax=Mameliella sp. TaxID=1924940 RepID=UPI003BA8CFD2